MGLVRRFGLSKSKFTYGLQCGRRLWLHVHRPSLEHYPPETQRRFTAGHDLDEVARGLYGDGVLIAWQEDLSHALRATQAALAEAGDIVLFEPAFRRDGVFVRLDMLQRRNGRYRMVEVKSATRLREHHLTDVAIQAWVVEGCGLPVDVINVAVIDPAFVYPGGDDYRGLLQEIPVADQVRPIQAHIPGWVRGFKELLDGPEPAIKPGPQCRRPFDCPFLWICEPRRAEATAGGGEEPEAPDPALARRDPAAADFLRTLAYPRFYLDFETVQFGVPVWAGTRPYEQLLFQWSCHVEPSIGELRHREFLDVSGDNPIRAATEGLLAVLGDAGPIFVYTEFEKWRLMELVAHFPDLAPALEGAMGRLVDLFRLTRDHYDHPALKGSYSLKRVLPTIPGDLDHADLEEVRDGLSAQAAYHEAADQQTSLERREELRVGLLEYCRLDTTALVRLARYLEDRLESAQSPFTSAPAAPLGGETP
jgi:hypothetical protein